MYRPPSSSTRPGSARPGTSRPPSTRPGTSMGGRSSVAPEDVGSWIVSIFPVSKPMTTGAEIGIGAYESQSGRFVMAQLADTQNFARTRHFLFLHPPTNGGAVVVPDSCVGSQVGTTKGGGFGGRYGRREDPMGKLLVSMIEEEWEMECEGMKKGVFDVGEGWDAINIHIVQDKSTQGVLLSVQRKDGALSAFAALIKYLRVYREWIFAPKSQRIECQAPRGTMLIDPETARDLELVLNTQNPNSKMTLKGIMDRTQTKMARRLLTTTILQPTTVIELVDNRLDSVEELIQSREIHQPLKKSLAAFKEVDLEKLAQLLSQRSTRTDPQIVQKRIGNLLTLRTAIKDLLPVTQALDGCRSVLLRTAAEDLLDKRTDAISNKINECLNEDVSAHQAKGQNKKALKIYAVKANFNQLLDVARTTHKENVNDIIALKDSLNAEHGLNMDAQPQEKGFIFCMKADDYSATELSRRFTNISRQGKKVSFTCRDLVKLNARMLESEEEVFTMCDEITRELLDSVVHDIACLYSISEALARLDMLSSFADISIGGEYVRPEFTSTLAIKAGRHPVKEKSMTPGSYVPNDTFANSTSTSFLLIQGANMSGKTTYLKQIGVLTVMAFCGCFVPAAYASFRAHDALLTRLSNDDSIERSLSTFAAEMSTMSMILSLATHESLILVDELGRGTAPIEGMAISQAIAEELIKRKSITFFVTHFKELAETLAPFPTSDALHLKTSSKKSASEFKTSYHYKVMKGGSKQLHYGLELARLAALPEDVMEKAEEVSYKLSGIADEGRAKSRDHVIATKRKIMADCRDQLEKLSLAETNPKNLKAMLVDLKLKVVMALGMD